MLPPLGFKPFRLIALLLLAGLASSCGDHRRGAFNIEGTIQIDSSLRHRARRRNVVLLVVAKNTGGIPIAQRRYINPQFPLRFKLEEDDLILPGKPWKGSLQIEALLGPQASMGKKTSGDIVGRVSKPFRWGGHSIEILLDTIYRPPGWRSRRRKKKAPAPEPEAPKVPGPILLETPGPVSVPASENPSLEIPPGPLLLETTAAAEPGPETPSDEGPRTLETPSQEP